MMTSKLYKYPSVENPLKTTPPNQQTKSPGSSHP